MTDADPTDPLRLPEEDQVVYELGAWSLDLQAEAAEVLAESQIPHAWDGTDLVVHVEWENMVDELLDALEREATGGVVDTSDDELLYELDEWSPEDREALTAKLDAAEITYQWEDGTTLIVGPEHEARIEAFLDELEYPQSLPVEEFEAPTDAAEAAEEASFEVLSSLYLAADRLKHHPLDAEGIENLTDALDAADPGVPPYGIVPGLWRDAVERGEKIADALADDDDRSDEVAAEASELQAMLRPFV
jgi:hypothetical protein